MVTDEPTSSRELTRPSVSTPDLDAALSGRYAIEQEIGSGGMAVVYLADDLRHHRKVGIKVLRPEIAAAIGADRFVRETETAAGLNHPHILPLYDSGGAGSVLFYVMPYVEGESLRQRIDREKQLPVEEAVAITRHVASALAYAHARNVIHRDVKPENILLHAGEPMLMDFGIALAAGAAAGVRLTQTGLLVGTPLYMSPEQAAGERVLDARSDQYSLACILYEMLVGEPPHAGATAQATIARRLTQPVPPVRELRDSVPPGVERALARALSTVPADRYPTVLAFAEALAEPVAVRPTSRSVAVLPFLNLSADPENEYFADGITEDVIAQLSRIQGLTVISRTSVMPFKKRDQPTADIAARLKVATLLDGSVRRSGGRVRIVAHLVDAATDRHLWAETYDRQLTDIFAIQTDVALHIAEALEAELSPREKSKLTRQPTTNLEAYQLYLQGRHCFNRFTERGFEQAIELFERAIEKDPGYALAYTTMALAYAELGAGVGGARIEPTEAYRRAREAVSRALELDSGLAEAHSTSGQIRFSCDFDYEGAERDLKRALELNPRSADTLDIYGRLLVGLGRYDEALEMQKRAHELDPLAHRVDRVTTLLRAGRAEEALEPALAVVELEPNLAHARATLGWVYHELGRPEEGMAELRQATSLAPGNTMFLAQLGQALARTGDSEGARQVLREIEELAATRYVSPYHLAYVYTGLGEHERAMDCLEQAYRERAGALHGLKSSFLFAPLRSHPRFQALLGELNLA